jgi:hypothetical protein
MGKLPGAVESTSILVEVSMKICRTAVCSAGSGVLTFESVPWYARSGSVSVRMPRLRAISRWDGLA